MQWPHTSAEYFFGINAEAVENQRQFVDQRDVDVALGVLDDPGRNLSTRLQLVDPIGVYIKANRVILLGKFNSQR